MRNNIVCFLILYYFKVVLMTQNEGRYVLVFIEFLFTQLLQTKTTF